ncbi:MAG TPA: hypothetical protein VFW44_01130 [Bryobacteraceae bacterium]|nr:hypothetical protein [Bryobacteraceae bacterium]
MTRRSLVAGLLFALVFALAAQAQLIPSGSPLPRTALPPVVFINGFQFEGCPTTFADTFGTADEVLQANGEVTLFFNTCSLPTNATIEDLGKAFGTFLAGLKYTDGNSVAQVDVVAHSMGGLVLRCYLSGKQDTAGVFQPPAARNVRKAIFLATPHFGTPIASLPFLGVVNQLEEMSSGSRFLFDLGTWNDATDDLRGVDAIAAIGNGGTGLLTTTPGFDDGVVPLSSASLRFYAPGRTRVLPYCHISGGGIIGAFGLCPRDSQGIAKIDSAMHESAQIIVSFLSGTDAWQSVGEAAEDNKFLSVDAGVIVEARAADDSFLPIDSATAGSHKLSISADQLAFSDMIPAGSQTLTAAGISASINLPSGGYEAALVKPGPLIARVFPAAAADFPLELAPRMIVALYGSNFKTATVSIQGSALKLFYDSSTQINAVLPDNISGFIPITVATDAGKTTVNVLLDVAAPALFTQDFSGTGAASALKSTDQSLVTDENPLHAGDTVELFATGLGLTKPSGGFDIAVQQPTVSVGGMTCPVTFAGAAPGFTGLDQINCTIPSDLMPGASVPVVIVSAARASNTATLAVD